MNNLYHKVAVASVCTALGFALGANEEAKAATFTLPPTITFGVADYNGDGNSLNGVGDEVLAPNFPVVLSEPQGVLRYLLEFNSDSFSQIPDIISVFLQFEIESFKPVGFGLANSTNPGSLSIFSYKGNGTAEKSDFEAGQLLGFVNVSSSSPGDIVKFDVTQLFKDGVSNNPFPGFAIGASNTGGVSLKGLIFLVASPG